MRDYEVVYIFKSSLTTEEIEGRLEAYHGKILGAEGSEITAVEHWGKRQLAYPIDRNDNGYYVVTQFTAAPGVLPDFERALKLDDDLLRHLVVLSEGELPMPVADERGGSDDRDNGDRRRGRDAGATASTDADGKGAGDGADSDDEAEGDDAGDGADSDDEAEGDDAGDGADSEDEAEGDDAGDEGEAEESAESDGADDDAKRED